MYPEKENVMLELKEKLTTNFPKTVSAFANYADGRIIFGVSDNGRIVGISNPEELRLQIENKINDSISPIPVFELKDFITEGKTLIELSIFRGKNTPYVYHNNAYQRSDTSTVKVDPQEFRRLAIDGSGLSYDQLLSTENNFSF